MKGTLVMLEKTDDSNALFQELNKQKKELEETKSTLDFIFNSTQDAMFMAEFKNNHFYYTCINAAYKNISGFQNDDMLGKTPSQVFGEETGQQLTQKYLEAVYKNQQLLYEEVFQLGKQKHSFLTSITPVMRNGSQYIICSRKDITQYKELQMHHNAVLERTRDMFDYHVATMLVIHPVSGKIIDANPAACRFYGYKRQELIHMNISEINMLPPDETRKLRVSAWDRQQCYFIFPHRLRNGEIRQVEVYSAPIGRQEEHQLFSIIFDVTDREQFRNNLFREKELLNTTLKSIGDGVVTTDTEGKITSLNKVAEDLTGWNVTEAIGTHFNDVFILRNEDTGELVESPVEKVLETGKIIGLANHTVLVHKNGQHIPIADSASPIRNEKGQTFGVVMVFRDYRSEKEHQDQILYLSYHDALTDLYNRRYAEEYIKQLNKESLMPISVIMADVNGLKITNDVFGHEAGDALLKNVADIFVQICNKDGTIIRWGGDEFLLIFLGKNLEFAEKVVIKLQRKLRQKKSDTFKLSVAMGCAEKTSANQDMAEVIQQAEEWMYHQKLLEGKSYRNTIINTLLATLYEKSMETEEHAKRLSSYCKAIGHGLSLSEKMMNELELFAVLHDIGKVGIHPNILKKPGPLTTAEFSEMKKHSEIGYRITQNTPELAFVSEYILLHHERWDGSGYPKGLRGEEIPICCSILAVADAFDAMTSDRVYRKAMEISEAIKELRHHAGTQFNPKIVQLFISLLEQKHVNLI